MTDRLHPPPRYKPRGWGDELRRRLHNAGLSAWELADLLGVHESAITMDALPNQPLHIILELARRLDLHPADLTPYAEAVYRLPRYRDAEHPPTNPAPTPTRPPSSTRSPTLAARSPRTTSPNRWAGPTTAPRRPSPTPSSAARTPCAARHLTTSP